MDNLKISRACDSPIGVFDSGIGGLSVLAELKLRLPNENFYYLSDIDNAPYGRKSESFIEKRCVENIRRLIVLGCKMIVIACNTATAVSVEKMRNCFKNISIIGLEPALRPAAEKYKPSEILVLATPVTLNQKRFLSLKNELETDYEKFVCIAAQETVSHVEKMTIGSMKHIEYLRGIFAPYRYKKFKGCVLGCTHFPFAKSDFTEALGYAPEYFDGAVGSAKRAEVILKREKIINSSSGCGKLLFSDKNCCSCYKSLITNKK